VFHVCPQGCVVPVSLPCKRLVYAPTGPVDRDYDDLRSFTDAAEGGMKRAQAAGAKRPLLVVTGTMPGKAKEQAELAALLGALAACYTTLEMRETSKEKAAGKVELVGWAGPAEVLQRALAIEAGRVVCRDLGGSDPERTAAPRIEEYVTNCFAGTSVTVEVQKGQEFFEREYPCLAAVNRCASTVPRHDGRVLWLTYKGEGTIKKTVYVVGKGITYDTGGADIKAGGVMAGMSRDKCGAAATAGLMASIAELAPAGVKVVGAMAVVRNSVGANCYVSDEIITSRAGVRIRVGNTDAEGRMAMVDVLCRAKELALGDTDPQIFTMATLTGHACLAVGNYSTIMDNGPARAAGTALQACPSSSWLV
jgi:leucyl aminopeptidase